MKVPYVHSNFERVEGDFYPTIDERCVYGFLEHFSPDGLCVDMCAPDGSGIVNTLLDCGIQAECVTDAFQTGIVAQWGVTNPPYDRKVVDKIILRQIERVKRLELWGLAVLLRTNFDHAKSRQVMFKNCPYYHGQIKLLFRPWWSENHDKQPIHNYVWHIWLANNGTRPITYYANGEKR